MWFIQDKPRNILELGYRPKHGKPVDTSNPPKGGSAMVMPKHPSKIPPLPPEATQD